MAFWRSYAGYLALGLILSTGYVAHLHSDIEIARRVRPWHCENQRTLVIIRNVRKRHKTQTAITQLNYLATNSTIKDNNHTKIQLGLNTRHHTSLRKIKQWIRRDHFIQYSVTSTSFNIFGEGIYSKCIHATSYTLSKGPGLEVIKLEYSLKLKIKRNDWLLSDTCPQAANHCAIFWVWEWIQVS